MNKYRELKILWDELNYFVFMQEWKTASFICEELKEAEKGRPITALLVKLVHSYV